MKRWSVAVVYAFFSLAAQAAALPWEVTQFEACVAFQPGSGEISAIGTIALETLWGIRKDANAPESVRLLAHISSDANVARDWQRLRVIRDEMQKLRPGVKVRIMLLQQLFGRKDYASDCQLEEVGIKFDVAAKYPELCNGKVYCRLICNDNTCAFQRKY